MLVFDSVCLQLREKIEKLKTGRSIQRKLFESNLTKVERLVRNENPNMNDIRVAMEMLENKYSELLVSDENMFTQMLEDDVEADMVMKEVEEADV